MYTTMGTTVQQMNLTPLDNATQCIPLNDTDDWIYRNESMKNLFSMFPDYRNKSQCEIEHGMQEMCTNFTNLLTFNESQLARVIVTWALFLISAIGNSFVIYCVYAKARSSHVHLIMLHFAIADLAFTFLVSPKDAIWNTTMQWYGGAVLCKICQTCTQIGMYVSSFMLVVMALDRYCGIVLPMSNSKQRKRTKYLVGGAWTLSILCALPAAYVFNLAEIPYCPDQLLKQCIDYLVLKPNELRPYNFFTMAMSFLVPMTLCVILYSLVACEITNMIKRDMSRVGRRNSSNGIRGARKKTLIMTSLITLTFLLFWGPYYAIAVHYWFSQDENGLKHLKALFILMYFHPAIHPFIYGVLMRDVRQTFKTVMLYVQKIITCSKIEANNKKKLKSNRSIDTNSTVLRPLDPHLTTDGLKLTRASPEAFCHDTPPHLLGKPEEDTATNTPSTCLPPHRDRRRDRYKSDGSYGVSSVKNATQASIYKGPRQRDGNVYHHDEHVSLLNGNAAAESAVANTRSTQNGNNVRTSQVKFLLPDNSQNSCDTPVGLNNNKEVFGPNSDSKVIASTDV